VQRKTNMRFGANTLHTRQVPLFWPEITKTRFNLSGELINVT